MPSSDGLRLTIVKCCCIGDVVLVGSWRNGHSALFENSVHGVEDEDRPVEPIYHHAFSL